MSAPQHWQRPDGTASLDAYRDEVAARRSGGWGVWTMACPCGGHWVAVAPLCAGDAPMECPRCRQMTGAPTASEPA